MTTSPAPHAAIGFKEFVALIAGMMAVNALGIDMILPALPAMGEAFGVADENRRQFIVTAYIVGFGSAQLVYGPLADRFGRKPVLLGALGIFVAMSLAASFATSFAAIVAARFLQGVGSAAMRVVSVSIVRDCYVGRTMARVMSLAFIVFLTVPILAPNIGALILLVAPWWWIFFVFAAMGAALMTWMAVRLPETLTPDRRRPISARAVADACRQVVINRVAIGYTLAMTTVFGSLFGFIVSVQQVFADVFRRGDIFTIAFAAAASTMGVAAWFNARIVERVGTRRVSHAALCTFVIAAAIHTAVALSGLETVWSFTLLQALTMAAFAMTGSNFGAMAMEPVGHIAGTASSVQGTISTVGGALVGAAIGQAFDGTTVPIAAGTLIAGVIALGIVLIVERGRLFRPQPHAAAGHA